MALILNLSLNCRMFERDPRTAQIGKEILPFEMGYLPDYFQRKAEEELNDTPENRQKCLSVLRELIEDDKNLNSLNFDDDFLFQNLRCKKYNVKNAFTVLKSFVNFRKNNKNLYRDFHFEKMSIGTKKKIITFLPYRCQDGCAIILIRLGDWIPEEFSFEDVEKIGVIFILQALRDPMTQVNGFKVIVDCKGNPFRHLRYITPTNMYTLYHSTQDCTPGRFKGVHIINKSFTFKAAWTLVQVFLTPKLKSRIHLHDTPERLLDHFPASILPVEYGGELKHYDTTKWLKDVMSEEKMASLGGAKFPDSF